MRRIVSSSVRSFLLVVSVAALAASLPAGATGWTWVNPAPTGSALTTLCQSQGGEIFVSGGDSTFLRKTAAGWQPLFGNASIHASASVTAADGTMFVLGRRIGTEGSTLLAWNGRSWSAVVESDLLLLSLWAFSARDVWMGGVDAGTGDTVAAHWDGTTSTTTVVAPDGLKVIQRLWASSASDIWGLAVNNDQTAEKLYHYDGKSWAEESLPSGIQDDTVAIALWGSGASRPLLVLNSKLAGVGARVWERSTSGWAVTKEMPDFSATAATGTSDGTLAIAGYVKAGFAPAVAIRKGGVWTQEQTATNEILTDLAGTPANGFLAIGEYDNVFARTSSGWTNLTTTRRDRFNDLVRRPDGTVLLCGYDPVADEARIVKCGTDGKLTTLLALPGGQFSRFRTGPDGVLWAVGYDVVGRTGFLYRSADGAAWTKDFETPSDFVLNDVLPTKDGVWAGGSVYQMGERGPDTGPLHIFRRASNGTWSDEYASPINLAFTCFLPTGGVPAASGYDPVEHAGSIGQARVFLRGSSTWEEKQTIEDLNFIDALPLPGGKALVVAHDNRASDGALLVFDGTSAQVVAKTPASSGQVFVFGIAAITPSSYLIPAFNSTMGGVLYDWDGKSAEMTLRQDVPLTSIFFAVDAAGPSEIWLAGYEGRLMKFDGGSDVAAGRTAGVTVQIARHRSTAGADLPGWYRISSPFVAASDVMDVVATVPSGGWAEFKFQWAPGKAVAASSLRLWTVEEQADPRQLFLDPGASPAPEGAFEVIDPAGQSLSGATQLNPGTAYTIRFTLRDGPTTRHDLEPSPGVLRGSLLLTTY